MILQFFKACKEMIKITLTDAPTAHELQTALAEIENDDSGEAWSTGVNVINCTREEN